MARRVPPALLFALLIVAIAGLVDLGPPERNLGTNVRLVYLHGAWVWTSLLSYAATALAGGIGLGLRRVRALHWSVALGQAATFFWVSYLPLSLWAMKLNWNGLFLEEPRWRVALDFAVIGVLAQLAILVLGRSDWGGAINIAYIVALTWTLSRTEQVMHPPSPILSSGSFAIQGFFAALLVTCIVACWQLARWLHTRAP